MELFDVKYKFLHCNKQKEIIEKMYGSEFNNFARNLEKYLSFLDRVAADNRLEELTDLINGCDINTHLIYDINMNQSHKVSEVICINCSNRWIAVRPHDTKLKDIECHKCNKQGYTIETGEDITEYE
jgi:DNA-directed RNA polymerase subunit RPC12/RpoP